MLNTSPRPSFLQVLRVDGHKMICYDCEHGKCAEGVGERIERGVANHVR